MLIRELLADHYSIPLPVALSDSTHGTIKRRLAYVYTNSGREGRWEGLDVPALRTVVVDAPAGRRLYRPIESFGKLYLQADAWHTDATGYALIARAVFDALKALSTPL